MRRRKLMTAACLALLPGLARAQAPARDAELIRAAEAGDATAVKRLLAQGASVRARDARGRTALVEMAVITYQYLPAGFGWTKPGYEYPLMWGLIMLAVALRGGGPYSLDRKLGWEL